MTVCAKGIKFNKHQILQTSNSPSTIIFYLPNKISCVDLLQYNCCMIMICVNIITCRNAVALVYCIAYTVANSFSIGGGASFTMILHILALIYKNFLSSVEKQGADKLPPGSATGGRMG